MREREYLSTLEDREFLTKLFSKVYSHATIEESIAYLESEHQLTGHEDMVNDGWVLDEEQTNYAEYTILYRKGTQEFEINEKQNYYMFTEQATRLSQFSDTQIDFLRNCADKIKREFGED